MSNNFADAKIQANQARLYSEEEERLVQILSDKYELPYIDLRGTAAEPDALKEVDEVRARKALVGAFKKVGKTIHVLIRDPESVEMKSILVELQKSLGEQPIVYIGSLSSLEHIWSRYGDLEKINNVERGALDLGGEHLNNLLKDVKTMADFQKIIEVSVANEKQNRTTKIIELCIGGALFFQASDVHIEPEEELVRFRYRLDGMLSDVFFTDISTYKLINSRFKLMSGMKISSTSKAQDGRFTIERDTGDIEVRVSLVPGSHGESFVMRLLDPGTANVDFDALGMNEWVKGAALKAIQKPNGMILTTGPTGSGKSTTLYSFIKKIYTPAIKIITIEDPVEYHLEGITQTPASKDYGFIEGLRAALRQDPDVIMIGEIRDEDTAKVAANAALTGHLVLSTLHTNNAFGAIPRLLDLGANPKTIGNALSLSIAQRLCRRLCPECKIARDTTESESRKINNIIGESIVANKPFLNKAEPKYNIYEANLDGCSECHAGYRGRVGIYEAFYMTNELNNFISSNPSEYEIKEATKGQGLPTLAEDAVMKILAGLTSIEEAERVVELTTL